jgi:hypothetical protein
MSVTLSPTGLRCPCGRAGLPDGSVQCLMCDLDDAQGSTGFRPGSRPAQTADAPTFRPPADQRCSRCDRILLSAPCKCLTPVEAYLLAADARDAAWAVLTPAERIEAIKARAAA